MGLGYYIFSHFLAGLIAVVLGFFVFLKNYKKMINKIFALFSLSVAIWAISYGIWLLADNSISALFWSRALNLAAILIPVFYLHWLLIFLNKNKKKLLIFYYILSGFFVLFSYSNIYISGTKQVLQFPYWPQMNWLYVVFLLVSWVVIVLYTVYLLINEYRVAVGNHKEQIRYILIGLVIASIGGSMNYLLMLGQSLIPPVGSALVVAQPILFGYAMIKHRLMDIRVVLRQYSVYLSSLITIIVPALFLKGIIDKFLPQTEQYADYFILVLAITFFPAIKNYFYKVANKYFFSSLYDDREVVSDLSDKLGSTLEIRTIYEYISVVLKKAFHTKNIVFLTYNEEIDEYEINYRKDMRRVSPRSFVGSESLNKKFVAKNKPIILSEILKLEYKENKQVYNLMKKWGIEIIVPLNLKDKVIGLLALSKKESGDVYNDTDLRILELIGVHAAMAIKNAQLYHETIGFNVRLTNEVEKATYKLREANKKLKKLDQAKSEFVSIASHQLRTPLTVVKGYVSMMLDGSFGSIPVKQKESLKKIYESNERLINLVENLLNISRIESGRLRFSYENTQLETMVESVFEELQESAKRKNLKFEYIKPKVKLPIINIDREKIRQVIMNLTDNSIKYTEKGYVKIGLSLFGDNIKFCVTDNGMGISEEDLPKLFTKFTRGQDISLVHTEGTGLGLYVAKQMIEAHGGKTWAESDGVGKGSRFCFVLPIVSVIRHEEGVA